MRRELSAATAQVTHLRSRKCALKQSLGRASDRIQTLDTSLALLSVQALAAQDRAAALEADLLRCASRTEQLKEELSLLKEKAGKEGSDEGETEGSGEREVEDLRASFREEIELSARITQGEEVAMDEENMFSPISQKSTRNRLSMSVVEDSNQLCRYFFSSRPLSLHAHLEEVHFPSKRRPQRCWVFLLSVCVLLCSYLYLRRLHC